MRLVLASGSPRRREILQKLGFKFEVQPSSVEENHDQEMSLVQLVEGNALLKARDIAKGQKDAVVLGSDTLVCLDDEALGKPKNLEDAKAMLRKMSGKKHYVYTGVALVTDTKQKVFHKTTEVEFKALNEEDIEAYILKVSVLDKAGSYGIQEHGEMVVASINGSFSNVMGLPKNKVCRELAMLGVFPELVNNQLRLGDEHRYPLIYNPNARSHRSSQAAKFMMQRATEFAVYASRSSENAYDLAQEFAEAKEPVVIAAGGDGTLNSVIRGLIGSKTALGVLPAGTMNVFARELGIPVPTLQGSNLDKAYEVIREGNLTEVDMFHAIVGKKGQPFVQMAGVGFDAQVIEKTTTESKKMFGPLAYLMQAVSVLGENPPKMRVICDDGREIDGVSVLAGNGELYGGQVRLFPKADNADGMLDVLVFKESGYKLVLDSLKGLAGVIDLAAKSVEYLQAREFKVVSNRPVPVEVDGEYAGKAEAVHFQTMGSRLRVLTPKEPQGGFPRLWSTWVNGLTRKLMGEES